jgi:hypothetical protein
LSTNNVKHADIKTRYIVLSIIGLLLLGSTYILFRLNSMYSARYSLIAWTNKPAWADLIYSSRLLILAIAVLSLMILIWVEYFSRYISSGLQQLLNKPKHAACMVILISIVSTSYYLQPGSITATADGEIYVGWAALLREYFRSLEAPLWSNAGALGFPFTQYYNWLSYVPTVLVGLFVEDILVANRLSLFALHVYSSWGMYLYVRKLTSSTGAGMTSAFAHGFAFYLYHKLVLVGLLPMALPVFLLPWQFYFSECMFQEKKIGRAWALTSLTSALSIISHLAYGLTASALLFIVTLCRTLLPTKPNLMTSRLRCILLGSTSLMFGLLASSLFIIPALTEPNNQVVGFINRDRFIMDLVQLNQVFSFSNSYLTPDWWGGYVGISIGLLAILGISLSLYRKQINNIGIISICFITSWLVFGPYYVPLFSSINSKLPFGKLVYGMHSPGYYIIYFGFACTVLSGICVHLLSKERSIQRLLNGVYNSKIVCGKYISPIVTLSGIAMLLIAIDLLPLTLLVNAMRPPTQQDMPTERELAISWLQQNGDKTSRVFESGNDSLLDIYVNTGQPQTAGLWDDRSPSAPFVESISDQEMFYLANVAYIISADREYSNLNRVPQHTILYENNSHSMILASYMTKTVGMISPLHRPTMINQNNNTAELIYIAHEDTKQITPQNSLPLTAQTIGYEWDLQRIVLEYELSQPAFVQISHSAYLYQSVKLDDREIKTLTTGLGLVGFWSDAGIHRVEIVPKLSPIRFFWAIINLIIILTLTIISIAPIKDNLAKQ